MRSARCSSSARRPRRRRRTRSGSTSRPTCRSASGRARGVHLGRQRVGAHDRRQADPILANDPPARGCSPSRAWESSSLPPTRRPSSAARSRQRPVHRPDRRDQGLPGAPADRAHGLSRRDGGLAAPGPPLRRRHRASPHGRGRHLADAHRLRGQGRALLRAVRGRRRRFRRPAPDRVQVAAGLARVVDERGGSLLRGAARRGVEPLRRAPRPAARRARGPARRLASHRARARARRRACLRLEPRTATARSTSPTRTAPARRRRRSTARSTPRLRGRRAARSIAFTSTRCARRRSTSWTGTAATSAKLIAGYSYRTRRSGRPRATSCFVVRTGGKFEVYGRTPTARTRAPRQRGQQREPALVARRRLIVYSPTARGKLPLLHHRPSRNDRAPDRSTGRRRQSRVVPASRGRHAERCE